MALDSLSVPGVQVSVLKNNARTYGGGTSVWFNLHTTAEASLGPPRLDFPDPTTLFDALGDQVPGVIGFPVTV